MSRNPFDETLRTLDQRELRPAADPNPFDEVIRQQEASRETGLRAAVKQTQGTSPDRAADVAKLSRATGIAPSIVERNFDAMKTRAEFDNTPFQKILAETPAVAEYVSDPAKLAIVKDDLEQLGALEWLLTTPSRSFARGMNQIDVARLRSESLYRDLTQEEHDRLQSARYHMNQGGALGVGDSWFRAAVSGASGQIPMLFGALYYGLKKAPIGAATGAAIGGAAGATAGGVGAIPGAIAGATFGATRGMAIGAAQFAFQLEAGLALDEFTEMKDEHGQAMDPDAAKAAAIGAGAINAGLETLGLGILLRTIPGAGKLTAAMVRPAVRKALQQTTTRALLAEAGKMYVGTVAKETAVEVAQRAVTIIAGEAAKYESGQEFQYRTPGDIGADLGREAVGALQSFALLTLPGPLAHASIAPHLAAEASKNVDFFNALGGAVSSSKTLERMPEALQDFIGRATKDGPVERVYAPIDTFTTYWQEKGVDPAEMATALTGDRDAYENALRTGEDLSIPTAAYAVKLAGTEHNAYFANELRLGPGEMNAREATTFIEEQKAAAAAASGEPAQPTGTEAIRAELAKGLQAAGVPSETAAGYLDLYESTFSNLAERAGVDPEQLFAQYGLTVERPELGTPAATQQQAPSAVQQILKDRAEERTEEGAAARAAGTDVPDNDVARRLERERNEPDDGATEDDQSFRDWAANASTVAADPEKATALNLRRAANFLANRQSLLSIQAQRTGTTPDQTVWAGYNNEIAWYNRLANEKDAAGDVLDKKAPGAQTTEGEQNADTESSPNRVLDKSRSPAGNRVAASDPGNGKSAEGRAAKHVEKVFGAVLASAQELDPSVNADELRAEFDYRYDLYRDQQQLAAESGNSVHSVLRAIAAYGGISLHEEAERASEIRQMFGGKTPNFGAVAGVRGVFRTQVRATTKNKKSAGHSIDVMLQMLQADPEFAWIESIDMLMDQIDESMRHSADKLSAAELPGTEELRDVSITRERVWWERAWRPMDLLEDDVDESTIDATQGDTSFDVTEFDQSLFDEFEALEEPAGDVLATGEVQPRLPEAGQVREQEHATPELAEAGFSLQNETAAGAAQQATLFGEPGRKPKAAKVAKPIEGQTTLFQEEEVTPESVSRWAYDVKRRAGDDVREFEVSVKPSGDLQLDVIIVSRGAQRAGLGSKLMRELTRFADRNGRRVLVNPGVLGEHGTTSRGRLVKFYKKFGFVENKGRHKDFSISAGMLREPTLPFALKAQGVEAQRAAATEPVATPEYLAASEAMTAADRAFTEATNKYRAREIDDAEYLAARATRDEAIKVYDAAFAAERDRELSQDEEEEGQPTKAKRGAIRFGADRQFTISLLERADLSTFLHETGHFYLEVFGDVVEGVRQVADPTAQQRQAIADYDALLKWFGVENREGIETQHHEQFARGFEAYLMEGRAPSSALRAAFARFRAWMIAIYRSVKGLRVELTDDVRRVLDRMVASDAAIAQAEQEASVTPMFTTAEAAGMSAAEFELYRRTIADASNAAREGLEVRLLAEVRREQTAAWAARREEIRTAVADETYRTPVYQAIAAMQRGTNPDGSPLIEGLETPPLKLSRKLLVERFGADRLKRLPRPYIYAAEGGMDPTVVAGMYGFSSADEFLKAIEEAEPMKARIARETDRRMLEEHGSILLDGTLQEKATAAVANDHRDEIIRAELRALALRRRDVAPFVQAGQAAVDAEKRERDYERRWFEAEARLRIAIAEGRKQVEIDAIRAEVTALKAQARGGAVTINAAIPPADALRQAARDRIARTRIRELRPDVFWNASRKAAKKAIDAAARQEFEIAIVAKQQELLSLALYREAIRAKEDIEGRIRAAIDLAKPAAQARLGKAGESYLEQVNAILDRYEFAHTSGKVLDRRASLRQWVAVMKAEGYDVKIPDDVLDDARRINYRELSVEELIGISDTLTNILHLSRLKNKLLKSAEAREYSDLRDRLIASIAEHNTARKAKLETRPEDERWSTFADVFASHLKIATIARVMDGGADNGLMWETFIRPLNEARDAERVKIDAAVAELSKAYTDHYSRAELAAFGDKLFIPAIGDSLSKEARLAVALNWGSATSQERLVNDPTRNWNRAQVQAILNTLDERDWRFVQAKWNTVGQFWGEIVAQEKRLAGIAPEKVEGVPISTKFGTVQGAYYPILYDTRRVARAKEIELDARALGSAAYAATNRGHIETRLKHTQLSVRLDLMAGQGHIEQVIHDLTHREVISDLSRLLRDRELSAAIYGTRGQAIHQQFVSAVSAVAQGSAPLTGADKAFRFVRSRTTLSLLGLNMWTALQQPLGMFNGAQRVGGKWVAQGLAKWVKDAATMQGTVGWIWDVSPMMRERGKGSFNQDLADLRQTLNTEGGWFDRLVRTATLDKIGRADIVNAFMWHISRMQRIADVPTWLGGYMKAMDSGVDEKTAIALADQAVIDSQGGADVKDLADVQRGSEAAKAFLLFYSYGSTTMNAAYAATASANLRSPVEVARVMTDLSLIYIAPAMGTVALAYALGKRTPDPDDDFGDFAIEVGRESLSAMLNGFLLVRELSAWTREDGGVRGYQGPAGTRLIQLLYRLKTQVAQGELDEAAWRALAEVAGVLFGIPVTQIEKTVDGAAALDEGRSSNPFVLLTGTK